MKVTIICVFLKIAYKQKHDAAKGFSDYAHMKEPPEIKHAMEVNKHQSHVSKPFLMIFWKIVVNWHQGWWVCCWSLNVTTFLFKKELQNFFYFYVPVFSQKHIWIILSIVIRTL